MTKITVCSFGELVGRPEEDYDEPQLCIKCSKSSHQPKDGKITWNQLTGFNCFYCNKKLK
jgi:hypothetical protein